MLRGELGMRLSIWSEHVATADRSEQLSVVWRELEQWEVST